MITSVTVCCGLTLFIVLCIVVGYETFYTYYRGRQIYDYIDKQQRPHGKHDGSYYGYDWYDNNFPEFCNFGSYYCLQKLIVENYKAISDFGLAIEFKDPKNSNLHEYTVNLGFRAYLNTYVVNQFIYNNIIGRDFTSKTNMCVLGVPEYEGNVIKGYIRYVSDDDCKQIQTAFSSWIEQYKKPSVTTIGWGIILFWVGLLAAIGIFVGLFFDCYKDRNGYSPL